MKTPLIFTLYLISGPVGCFDVLGHTGGSIMIYCEHKEYGLLDKYFCRRTSTADECVYLKWNGTQSGWVQKGRYSLSGSSDGLMVIVSQLSLQDTGLYQCGETGVWSHDVKLTVKTDPCCSGPKTVAGYLGETVTISCPYPEEFETNIKLLFKLKRQYYSEVIRTTESGDSRFSISEDRSSGMFSVRISDVGEDDGGVYYCTVGKGGRLVSYFSLFTEIQLQVTGKEISTTSKSLLPTMKRQIYRTTTSPEATMSDFNSSVIITICVCMALIGGSVLIFYKRTKAKGPNSTTDGDYQNDPAGIQNNIRMGLIYVNLEANTSQQQSKAVLQGLEQNINQSDLLFESQNLNTDQSDPIYQSLDDNTNKSDSAYQSLSPDTKQSDSVYKSLNPNSHQSDSGYQSINPKTNQSDSIYQSLNPNTNQSDSAYQSLNPMPSNKVQPTKV